MNYNGVSNNFDRGGSDKNHNVTSYLSFDVTIKYVIF